MRESGCIHKMCVQKGHQSNQPERRKKELLVLRIQSEKEEASIINLYFVQDKMNAIDEIIFLIFVDMKRNQLCVNDFEYTYRCMYRNHWKIESSLSAQKSIDET